MSARAPFRPRRPLKNEVYSFALALVAPVALVCAFPYRAASLADARAERPAAASCAVVFLTEDEAVAAIEAARMSWRPGVEDVRRLQADLTLSTVPDEPFSPVVSVDGRERAPRPGPVRCLVPPLPPTAAAPAPAPLPRDGTRATEAPAFPRSEFLNMEP